MKLLEVKKIWDKAEHNAFTDLIFYKNTFYCAFREADDHMSYDGSIRVISSKDCKSWKSLALLQIEKKDLRDPKFSITANNELMLNAGIRLEVAVDGYATQSVTWFSKNGKTFSKEVFCKTSHGTWRWSTTWNKSRAYSFAYTGKDKLGCLYRSKNGKDWQVLQDEVYLKKEEKGNETSLVFKDNKAYCLLRRDGGKFSAMFGTSTYPYKNWRWKNLRRYIGGPKMLYVNNKFLIAGRFFNGDCYTALAWYDEKTMRLKEALKLPSGGDSSYAGLVNIGNIIYMSYYSSHEEKTSIYLARIKI